MDAFDVDRTVGGVGDRAECSDQPAEFSTANQIFWASLRSLTASIADVAVRRDLGSGVAAAGGVQHEHVACDVARRRSRLQSPVLRFAITSTWSPSLERPREQLVGVPGSETARNGAVQLGADALLLMRCEAAERDLLAGVDRLRGEQGLHWSVLEIAPGTTVRCTTSVVPIRRA